MSRRMEFSDKRSAGIHPRMLDTAQKLYPRRPELNMSLDFFDEQGNRFPHDSFREISQWSIETTVYDGPKEFKLILPNLLKEADYNTWLGYAQNEVEVAAMAKEVGLLAPTVYQLMPFTARAGERSEKVYGLLRSTPNDEYWPNIFTGAHNQHASILRSLGTDDLSLQAIFKLMNNIPQDMSRIIYKGIRLPIDQDFFQLVIKDHQLRILLGSFAETTIEPYDHKEIIQATDTLINAVLHILVMNMSPEEHERNKARVSDILSYCESGSDTSVFIRSILNSMLDQIESTLELPNSRVEGEHGLRKHLFPQKHKDTL